VAPTIAISNSACSFAELLLICISLKHHLKIIICPVIK